MTLRQEKGRAGEDAAADWLEKAGMRILARNWRSGSYELDLVCRDGDELVFVEVRLRGKGSLASPEASMTPPNAAAWSKPPEPTCPQAGNGMFPADSILSASVTRAQPSNWIITAMSLTSPKLWVVATPLGNPGDLSPRAREVLEGADMVLAEDTRRAGLLCQRCGVKAKRFMSFHDHNEESKLDEVLGLLNGGRTLALISDAGLPLVADPGYRLVRACRAAGIPVSVVPGPSAPVTALAGSGIAPQPFAFLGFLPRSRSDQEKTLAPFANLALTLIFFERKDRLSETLSVAHAVLGPRELCIARELTKTHEEYLLGRLEDGVPAGVELLGEITVVVGPAEAGGVTDREEVFRLIAEERELGGSPRDVARRVQTRTAGWTVKSIYALLSARR